MSATGKMSPLAKWVYQKKYHATNENRITPTHYLMGGFSTRGGGGKLFIPKDDYNEFLLLLAESLKRKFPISIVELAAGSEFRFFLDVDIKLPEIDIVEISNSISKVLSGFYTGRILCFSSEESVVNEETKKQGLHIYCPDFIVSVDTASATQQKLCRLLNAKYSKYPWDDMIDSAVYRSNQTSSLRMPYSVKYGQCPCKNALGCDECSNAKNGRILINNVYSLMFKENNGVREETDCVISIHDCLKEGSIRYDNAIFDTEVPKKVNKNEVQGSDDMTLKFRNYFKRIHPRYNDVKIQKVTHLSRYSVICVSGANAHFCINKNECHGTNRIYFQVDTHSRKMVCKCYSQKQCSDFKTSAVTLPQDVVDLLGNKTEKRKATNVGGGKTKKVKKSFEGTGMGMGFAHLHVRI